MTSKEFDIIVFGATGFTGALVARYLLQEKETAFGETGALKWAIAGRNAKKLEQVKQELKEKVPTVSPISIDAIPLVIADSSNESDLVALVKRTKVVLTVVGPYTLYGEPLVKACVEHGVHYCDLTGELPFVNKMIQKYGATAVKTGAVLIHCCGFESVPSDLTTLAIVDAIKEKTNSTTSKVIHVFEKIKGAVSGGTIASVFTIMDTCSSAEMKEMRNPFYLTDETTRAEKRAKNLLAPNASSISLKYEKDLKTWTSLFIGGSVNQALVHRSNYLLKGQYGDSFVYQERSATGGWIRQLLMTTTIAVGAILLNFKWTRELLRKLAPAPGTGPSEEVMQTGFFISKAVGYDAKGQLAVKATTVGTNDCGYMMTSKVISNVAISLAKKQGKVSSGGFYTTASALGSVLTNRLKEKGIMSIEVKHV